MGEVKIPWSNVPTLEIERSTDVESSCWHGWFKESKYQMYEESAKTVFEQLCVHNNSAESEHSNIQVNPGPQYQGIKCKQNQYGKKLYHSFVYDENNRNWVPSTAFSYPRIGAFEVFVKKGRQRVEVFSKLKTKKWPNKDWLADRIAATVDSKLSGWTAPKKEVKIKKKYAGVDGKLQITDDELRALLKKKCQTLAAAFRLFDKNGDGEVSKGEFFTGLKQVGVDMPPAILERLWAMADEDKTGAIVYQEFARKFANYKHTASMHRHVGLKSEADAKAVKLHGVAAGSRMAKTSQHRKTGKEIFAMDMSDLRQEGDEDEEDEHMTIQKLSRSPTLNDIPASEATPDEIRAKIYKRNGNLLNAFRQMDNSGDSRISYEEFQYFIPKVLGEEISSEKVAELWRSIDVDGTGEIDIDEFASGKLTSSAAAQRAVAQLRDMAVDPTMGQKADHQKVQGNFTGLGIEADAQA